MSKKSEYLSKFEELEIIGRGNFGSATLVRSKVDNNIYVSKKVLLGNLNQKEVEGAHLEVKLLKELRHPHIVEYIDSFIEDGVLIIIMEYCEEGDLAYFIKRKAQKGEFLEETLILNWFLQILLALEFVHRKKILHRDIKSSNIFLRSNGTVKLGDFGISKILDHTAEAAMTVVGTPYYMSPEVCENKPYTFKSDVWALGCVLYEMCTLKHAFSAENLLGLVFKIVREKQDPIPSIYSPEMHMLIQKLLTKNVRDRPSIRDIFMEPLIQKTIEEFIRTDGNFTTMIKIPIKKTHLHNEIKKMQTNENTHNLTNKTLKDTNTLTMGDTVVSMVSNEPMSNKKVSNKVEQPQNETPLQRMLRRKEEQRKIEEEKMRNAAKEAFIAKSQNRDRKTKELQGNANITGTYDKTSRPNSSKQNQSRSTTQETNQAPTQNAATPVNMQNSQQFHPQPQPQPQPQPHPQSHPQFQPQYQHQYQHQQQQQHYNNMDQTLSTYNSVSFQNQMQNNLNNPNISQQNPLLYNTQNSMTGGYSDIYYSKNMQGGGYANPSQLSQMSAFNLTKEREFREMQNNFMDVTNQSLSFSLSNDTLASQLHQTNSDNYFKTNIPYNNGGQPSQFVNQPQSHDFDDLSIKHFKSDSSYLKNRPSIEDDRPLPTLAHNMRAMSQEVKNPSSKPQQTKSNDYEDDYDDYYEDDFEEYESDDENDDASRLTMKASDNDLSMVVDLYKEKLKLGKKKDSGFEEIKEMSTETTQPDTNSPVLSSRAESVNPRQPQIDHLKARAKEALGEELFEKAYSYLKKQRNLERPDSEIQKELNLLVGKKNMSHCFTLDQIIFLETMNEP